jgi:2',3'-cyclic-nucleotide 2'-phosphodiesterase (5'-nucleotidase family)
LLILHTNDIHGRSAGLARVITLVEQARAENTDCNVIYVDSGDIEDTSNHLSNLTKGESMHRLMALAKPTALAVGNGSLLRYGWQVIQNHANAAGCPLLLANVRLPDDSNIPGTIDSTLIELDGYSIGLIGITAKFSSYSKFFKLKQPDTISTVSRLADGLWEKGAAAVIVLSHLGLGRDEEFRVGSDIELAQTLSGKLTAIIGAHSHHLLPEGEWVGETLIAQAGNYAEHLGKIRLAFEDGKLCVQNATVQVVTDDIMPSPLVAAEEAQIEAAVEEFLSESVGEISTALDWAEDCECGIGNLMADALRHRMKADIGVLVVSASFKGGLPAGQLERRVLWEMCDSSGNPGVAILKGWQVQQMLEAGLDAEKAAERPRPLRGRARGLMHISGASVRHGRVFIGDHAIDPEATYRVAASDFELEPDFGYTQADWELNISYEVPTILREALVDYLAIIGPVNVSVGRIVNE